MRFLSKKILVKGYYRDIQNPANNNHFNPIGISNYFYDIDNIEHYTGSYRNSSAVSNKILRHIQSTFSLRIQSVTIIQK